MAAAVKALLAMCVLLGITCVVLAVFLGRAQIIEEPKQEAADGKDKDAVAITRSFYGRTAAGEDVYRYRLRSARLSVTVITLGGTVTALHVPDRHGQSRDVVLGYTRLADYETNHEYFGSLIGRFANRVAGARFSLDGKNYTLDANDGSNHLHGGPTGWHTKVWRDQQFSDHVRLTYESRDGDSGYPGDVAAAVTYAVTSGGSLVINYTATASRATPINLTGHSYFNLGGEGSGNIYDHNVTIHADSYLPVDDQLIPTGAVTPVANTPFDLRPPGRRLGDVMEAGVEFDHNFCVRGPTGSRMVVSVSHARSGRVMEVWSNQPGVQFYTGNFLNVSRQVEGAKHDYGTHYGFCVETQGYPDAPNRENFPDSILRPNSMYFHQAEFKFSTMT